MTDSGDRSLVQRLKDTLGDTYTIEGEIGRGGMGVVYRARDERLQRRVAIKVLPPELAFQKDIKERFTREAQTAARLSHPHIVPIYDVGQGQGLVYFIMGLVDGESLGARIKRRGRLPTEEARRIMKETADALSAAHGAGVIHRDIKPDNILLEGTRGRVMVTDFGIAKALSTGSGATLTGIGVAIGTPSYMSPEQAAGEREIDGRSDLYSLGVVSFQMLTGELPFNAPTVAGILMKQITEPAPVLHEKRGDIPEDLSLAVSRCLEKDPENRWATADALRRALESRQVTGYRPTLTGMKSSRNATNTRPRTAPASPLRPLAQRSIPKSPNVPMPARPPRLPQVGGQGRNAGGMQARIAQGQWVRNERGEWIRTGDPSNYAVPDTGEPAIVQKVRGQFARWAGISGGLFFVNLVTDISTPWSLIVAAFMGIGLVKSYAQLWHAGYSWRDVLNRPPAPDAITVPGSKNSKARRQIPPPKPVEFGVHYASVMQVHNDRVAILALVAKLPPADREMLQDTDIEATTEGLYQKAIEMARALYEMDTNFGEEGMARVTSRLETLRKETPSEERDRRITLLESQLKTATDLASRRSGLADRLESSVLAMQNLRFDLLRLRSAGVGAVIGDLTQTTQKARAISRDVDHAIAAAAEIREAMG